MNFALGVVALIVCVIVALVLSNKFVERKKFYGDFNTFNKRLTSEISYSQASILSLIDEYKDKNTLFFNNLRLYFENNDLKLTSKHIKKDEIDYFLIYLKTIGTSDKNTQLEFLNGVNSYLEKHVEESIADEKKYRALYVKLGFLFGIMALIILL